MGTTLTRRGALGALAGTAAALAAGSAAAATARPEGPSRPADAEESAYLAALPTAPDPLDARAVWEDVAAHLAERYGGEIPDGAALAGVVALSLWGRTQGYRWTAYEHELRRYETGGIGGLDLLVNRLVYEGVELGARMGWGLRAALDPDPAGGQEPPRLGPGERTVALIAAAYARAGGADPAAPLEGIGAAALPA